MDQYDQQHRGMKFNVIKGKPASTWTWTIVIGDGIIKSGSTIGSRHHAMAAAKRAIDKAIGSKPVSRRLRVRSRLFRTDAASN